MASINRGTSNRGASEVGWAQAPNDTQTFSTIECGCSCKCRLPVLIAQSKSGPTLIAPVVKGRG
jgi:hypothetical protein